MRWRVFKVEDTAATKSHHLPSKFGKTSKEEKEREREREKKEREEREKKKERRKIFMEVKMMRCFSSTDPQIRFCLIRIQLRRVTLETKALISVPSFEMRENDS